jgi:UDP-2,3-diacylglucosamine hydrolase
MSEKTQIFFASDLHLGMHPASESIERERWFVQWLETIRKDARELWLLGDVFDYWFEYRKVVPRGFTRFLGKLAQLSDEGVEIHLFTGNHDVWIFNYLPEEIGLTVHRKELLRSWGGKNFLLGHGDGLVSSDRAYRFLQGIFHNRLLQWTYARIHPNGSTSFAQWWSRNSRMKKGSFVPFLGVEKEHQLRYARKRLEKEPGIDYFVFGHRHIPYDIHLDSSTRVICLGDWISNFTYAFFDGKELHLRKFFEDRGEIIRIE